MTEEEKELFQERVAIIEATKQLNKWRKDNEKRINETERKA